MRKVASGQKGRNQKGFTLLELLVTITIIGIVVAIGTPAVSSWSQRAQVQSETQKYVGVLSLARSTAISNNQVITIAFAAPDADGSIDVDVFSDSSGAGNTAFAGGNDVYIRRLEGEASSIAINLMPQVNFVSFDANGRLMGGQAIQISITNDNADVGRLININPVGRAAVSEIVF